MPAIKPLIVENTSNISKLVNKVSDQQKEIDSLKDEIDMLKQQAKKKTIVISGLKPTDDETADKSAMRLMKQLKINLHPTEIDDAFRVKKRNKETPDIIVALTTHRKKVEIMTAKKNLRQLDEQIYINEQLTPRQGELFASTRSLVKQKRILATWTRDGKVYVKKDGSSPFVINNIQELKESA